MMRRVYFLMIPTVGGLAHLLTIDAFIFNKVESLVDGTEQMDQLVHIPRDHHPLPLMMKHHPLNLMMNPHPLILMMNHYPLRTFRPIKE